MKFTINWALCEGNGACVAAAPQIFDIDDDDNLVVLDEAPPADRWASLQDAAARCPKRAILIED